MGNCWPRGASAFCGAKSNADEKLSRDPRRSSPLTQAPNRSYPSKEAVSQSSGSTGVGSSVSISSQVKLGQSRQISLRRILFAISAWLVLQLAEYYILPTLSSRCWSFICCLVLFASFRVPVDENDGVVETVGVQPMFVAGDPAETKEELQQFLAELEYRKGNVPLCDAGGAISEGWIEASKPPMRLFLKMATKPDRLLINLQLKISDQVASLPIVDSEGDSIRGGIVPIFCAPIMWPTWLPFCESATLLRHIAIGQQIWQVKFRCAFITADAVVYVGLTNDMAKTGKVECVIGGPEDGGKEGQSWLGIKVPKQTGQLRVPVRSCHICLTPTSATDGFAHLQADLVDALRIKWIHLLFWRTLCTWVLPTVAKVHAKFSGSALDRHYNGDGSGRKADETQFLLEMSQQIAAKFPAHPMDDSHMGG